MLGETTPFIPLFSRRRESMLRSITIIEREASASQVYNLYVKIHLVGGHDEFTGSDSNPLIFREPFYNIE
jgi:hypothetical protein